MQKAQGAKLGLLALLTVSHSLRGPGDGWMRARSSFLGRVMNWARRR